MKSSAEKRHKTAFYGLVIIVLRKAMQGPSVVLLRHGTGRDLFPHCESQEVWEDSG